MREDEPGIAPGTGVAYGSCPAELMIDKPLPAVGRNRRLDYFRRELHTVTSSRHPRAQLVIVGQIIQQRRQAANVLQRRATHRQRRAKAVSEPAFNRSEEHT